MENKKVIFVKSEIMELDPSVVELKQFSGADFLQNTNMVSDGDEISTVEICNTKEFELEKIGEVGDNFYLAADDKNKSLIIRYADKISRVDLRVEIAKHEARYHAIRLGQRIGKTDECSRIKNLPWYKRLFNNF